MTFPKKFAWGAATASYQIEGAFDHDGKGLSVWDKFSRQPGKTWSGDTGEIACDHYHRYEEDVRLMADIGLNAYRLSISWPRVLPGGTGSVNERGLTFYDRLIDALLENGVQPWVTLFHWDYPHALYCRGGWLNRDSADWFAGYTRAIVDRLSDRVSRWMTLNEPQVFIGLGHFHGEHAPGLKLSFADTLRAGHHALLAHGQAVQAIRANAKSEPKIGAAPVGLVKIPSGSSPTEIEAARTVMFSISKKDFWNNTWFSDPMILGHYPADGLKLFAADLPEIQPGDMATICQPLDFYGANIYNGQVVQTNADGSVDIPPIPVGAPITNMGWTINPEAMYWGPRFYSERYHLPIVVTENGISTTDWVHLDGKIHDAARIDFHARYLQEYHRGIAEGIPAEGYFIWSLMDNFEWAYGYKQRFGLIHVDYATGKRTLKDSASWYRQVIQSNGAKIGLL